MKTRRPITRKSITPAQFRNFIFAGRSVFTLENKTTNNYVTFKIKQVKKNNKPIDGQFAVECKMLNDTQTGYVFLGFLNTITKRFNKHRRTPNDYQGFKVLFWLLSNLERLEDFSDKQEIYHEGHCCKCGLPLTVPESIDSGIGPECNRKMLANSIDILKKMGTWVENLSYEENVRIALKQDPAIWNKIHIPDNIKPEEEFKVHRLFTSLGIF
jgi:hypothetical protein